MGAFSFVDRTGRKSPAPSLSTTNGQQATTTNTTPPSPRSSSSDKDPPANVEKDNDSNSSSSTTTTTTTTTTSTKNNNTGTDKNDKSLTNSTTPSPPSLANFNPSLTAIPQYPRSPTPGSTKQQNESPRELSKHSREASRSLFSTLKTAKSYSSNNNNNKRSNSPGQLSEKPKTPTSGSSDRRTQYLIKPYGSSPDLLGSTRSAEEQQEPGKLFYLSPKHIEFIFSLMR